MTGFTLRTLLVFLVSSIAVQAGNEEFEQANRLYETGSYHEAAVGYRKLIAADQASAALYFNLGNALFQGGDFGRGIWSFRQAHRIAPRDPDIRANLQFSRKEVAGAFAPAEEGWKSVFRQLSPAEWKWLVAVSAGILFCLLAGREYLRRRAGGLIWPIRIFMIMTFSGAVFSAVGHQAWDMTDEAVVVQEKADARYGPLDDSKTAFTLKDGEEVVVTGAKGEWRQIMNTSGQSGWVRVETIQVMDQGLPPIGTE
jgi:hypothetical protein